VGGVAHGVTGARSAIVGRVTLPYPVLWPMPTRWADNDHYGHVNNVTYYSYFDTAVNGWLMQATGTDIRELPAIGVVAQTSCTFTGSVSFPDQLRVGLRISRLGRSSITYDLGLYKVIGGEVTGGEVTGGGTAGTGRGADTVVSAAGENGAERLELSATGTFVHVYVDAETRRPVEIPEVVRAAAAAIVIR